jgi:transcriptional regulator
MLYMPSAFRVDDLAALHDHIDQAGLATLVSVGADRPVVSHVPMLLERDAGKHGTLIGHLARGNPQIARSNSDYLATAIFMGPDAYVSPGWYAAKREHGKVVPTWNYAVVHARGPLVFFEDRARLRSVVDRLTTRHERRFAKPWATTDAPADYIDAQLRAIVGFELAILEIDGKFKLSQNRPEADQAGVASALANSDSASDRATAALMGRVPVSNKS